MSQSIFEYDELEFLKLDENKIECLHYFGYRLAKGKHTYIANLETKTSVVYIKQLNKMTLLEVFNMLHELEK